MAANSGRFFGGNRFAIIGASGTVIPSTTPPSQQIFGSYPANAYGPAMDETTWRHGMRQITSLSGLYDGNGFGPAGQCFDGRTHSFGGGGPMPYEHADNVNPGATGSPLLITSPCTIIQALSRSDVELLADEDRSFLRRRDVLHFLASAPPTGSLPPPIGAVPLVPRYTEDDIAFTAFPDHAPVSGGPSPEALLASIRWDSNIEWTNRPPGDYYVGHDYENTYASEQARVYSDVGLALCSDIDATTRKLLGAHVVIHAQNTVEYLNAGARYNWPGGLGGILAGRKLFVVLAYIITGDSYFGDWASRTDWAAEDMQVRRVDAAAVAAYDYISADEGMGDWNANWERATGSITRTTPKSTYQNIFTMHGIGQALSCMMVTGGKAAWNNDALFDYIDRIMERTLYDGSGTNKWARTLTGTNAPSAYHKAVWDTYRTETGMPAIWNW